MHWERHVARTGEKLPKARITHFGAVLDLPLDGVVAHVAWREMGLQCRKELRMLLRAKR